MEFADLFSSGSLPEEGASEQRQNDDTETRTRTVKDPCHGLGGLLAHSSTVVLLELKEYSPLMRTPIGKEVKVRSS